MKNPEIDSVRNVGTNWSYVFKYSTVFVSLSFMSSHVCRAAQKIDYDHRYFSHFFKWGGKRWRSRVMTSHLEANATWWTETNFSIFGADTQTFISLAVYGGKFVILVPLIMKGKEVKARGKRRFQFPLQLLITLMHHITRNFIICKICEKPLKNSLSLQICVQDSLCFSCLSNARLPFPLHYYHLTFGINHLIKMNVQAF